MGIKKKKVLSGHVWSFDDGFVVLSFRLHVFFKVSPHASP